MNKFCFNLALFLALGLWLEQSNAQSVSNTDKANIGSVTFTNGDFLRGSLLEIRPDQTFVWQLPDSPAPAVFKLTEIAQIDLTSAPKTHESNKTARVELKNGDVLAGQVIDLSSNSLTLQTAYAGTLHIPRLLLRSIILPSDASTIFDGIIGLEGWTLGASNAALPQEFSQWTYRNNAFYASKPASIARDVHLPFEAEIQFDLAWKGALNLAIAFYTDSLQPILLLTKEHGPAFGGFYSLRINNSVADLWPTTQTGRLHELGQAFLPAVNGRDRLHVDLRASKSQHKIALFLDDALVKEWIDPEGFVGQGTGMRFVQNAGSAVKLSHLLITPWDGNLADPRAGETEASDTIWPANAAKILGQVQSINNGVLQMQTSNGIVTLPLHSVHALRFKSVESSAIGVFLPFVRATFSGGGSVTFTLISWQPRQMQVDSPDFGLATFNPSAFSRMEFFTYGHRPDQPKNAL